MWLMQNAMAKPDNAGAASYDYMHLFGRVALGMMWVKIAQAAMEKKAREPGSGAGHGRQAFDRAASTWSACCRKRACASRASQPAPTR